LSAADWRRALALAVIATACKPDAATLEARAGRALQITVPAMQASYRDRHGRYASSMRDLTANVDTLSDGIRVLIHTGTTTGWAATASHPSLFGAACAVYVGTIDTYPMMRGRTEPREPGLVTCTSFAPWAKQRIIKKVTIGRVVTANR
jgi:hypothetical protein